MLSCVIYPGPWIGRCVGRYNHRLFWTYLLVDMTTSVFAFLRLVAGIGVVPTQLSWLVANAPTLLLLPFIFFNGPVPLVGYPRSSEFCRCVGFFIISLLWSHTGTALTGITGWEAMKHANIWYLSDMPQVCRCYLDDQPPILFATAGFQPICSSPLLYEREGVFLR